MLLAHPLKWAGNAFMLCVCASWSEYIRFSQLAILQVKTSDIHSWTTANRIRLRACLRYDKWQKMLIMFVCAGLTLTPRAQVYLCLRCYHEFMRDKERILIFSTYDEFKHPSIFGVCALLLILLHTKNAFIFIPLRILLRIFFIK